MGTLIIYLVDAILSLEQNVNYIRSSTFILKETLAFYLITLNIFSDIPIRKTPQFVLLCFGHKIENLPVFPRNNIEK